MLDWWEENGPPVYISVAAYLGLHSKKTGKKSSSKSKSGRGGDLNELAAMFSGNGGMIQ